MARAQGRSRTEEADRGARKRHCRGQTEAGGDRRGDKGVTGLCREVKQHGPVAQLLEGIVVGRSSESRRGIKLGQDDRTRIGTQLFGTGSLTCMHVDKPAPS